MRPRLLHMSSLRRRPLLWTAAMLAAIALGSAGWWLSAPLRSSAQPAAVAINRVQGASWRPEVGQPLFVAVLGSDIRSGPPGGGGGRCDAIHILAINPKEKAGTILNFPRDSFVGGSKLNDRCLRGPESMVQALTSLTGIPIQYYVATEFSHFMRLIDELGGLEINVPYAMNDAASGARFSAGPRLLLGGDVLAFTRNRKDTPKGDFSRTENQGAVIVAGLRKFRAEAADPHRILDYLRVGRRHTKFNVPVTELIELVLLAREIDPARIRNVTVPGSVGTAGAASVVFLAPGDTYSRVKDDGIY